MRFLSACVVALLPFAAHAASEPLGIVTGPKTGTYYAFGKDIADVAAKVGVETDIKPSEGSIDNIKRINSSENAALGIVQSDVLGFLSRSKNPDSIKMASKLRMVFPFYNEEVHVLARKSIKSFSDLEGKKIAIGEDGSGNMLTSVNLFAMMGVTPGETLKMPPAQGIVSVLKGEADAAVFVGGKPVRLFKNLEDLTLPENQKYAPMLLNVRFLPLDNPKMLEEYKPASITPSDYKFVTETVPTISVQAVMVDFDFAGNKDRCTKLAALAKALKDALPGLKEKGHPKWKEVNLEGDAGIWKKDSCVWPEAAKETAAKTAPSPLDSKDLISILEKK